MASEIHVVVLSVRGSLLWCTWEDGLVLLQIMARHVPFRVIAVMPDHVHIVLCRAEDLRRLFTAMKAYSRHLGRTHGATGRTWSRHRKVKPIADDRHLDEVTRYILRNPLAKGLADDPLGWPLSVARDMVGLVLSPLCAQHPDPAAFHARLSSRSRPAHGEAPEGTPFPVGKMHPVDGVRFRDVAAAVSALARVPASLLAKPGPVRDLLFHATRLYTRVPLVKVAAHFGLDPTVAYKALRKPRPARELDLVGQVLGDARFFLMPGGDLRREPGWRYYRRFQAPWERVAAAKRMPRVVLSSHREQGAPAAGPQGRLPGCRARTTSGAPRAPVRSPEGARHGRGTARDPDHTG